MLLLLQCQSASGKAAVDRRHISIIIWYPTIDRERPGPDRSGAEAGTRSAGVLDRSVDIAPRGGVNRKGLRDPVQHGPRLAHPAAVALELPAAVPLEPQGCSAGYLFRWEQMKGVYGISP